MGMRWVVGLLGFSCLVGVGGAQTAKPMAVTAHPAFEVAAIKLTRVGDTRQGINADGHGMTLERQTVKSMMMFAYGVHGKQIVGEPAWVDDEAYDVKGVLDTDGDPSVKQMQEVLQKLLADRFGLKIRHEKREMSYFAMRVAGSAKLTRSAVDTPPDQSGNGGAKGMEMKFTSNTMDDFTLGMQYFAERPVVNETGLAGRWDFTLKWTPDEMKDLAADAPPGLFTAMKEQLGLKMEPAKGPVDVLVVDGVSRPSAN